jgi:Ala-tRNA(Pro) deacylase
MPSVDTYNKLFMLLDDAGARYRIIDHPSDGRTDVASLLRGHALEQAAKCLVIRVGLAGKRRRYVIGVVPGDRRVDLEDVRALYDGTDAALASRDVAERLTGCVSGTIMPFSFTEDLDLVVDPALLRHAEIYFNAARLDRSVALAVRDYVNVASPHLASISDPARTATAGTIGHR